MITIKTFPVPVPTSPFSIHVECFGFNTAHFDAKLMFTNSALLDIYMYVVTL